MEGVLLGELNFTKLGTKTEVIVRAYPTNTWVDIRIGSLWLILTREQAQALRKELEVIDNDTKSSS